MIRLIRVFYAIITNKRCPNVFNIDVYNSSLPLPSTERHAPVYCYFVPTIICISVIFFTAKSKIAIFWAYYVKAAVLRFYTYRFTGFFVLWFRSGPWNFAILSTAFISYLLLSNCRAFGCMRFMIITWIKHVIWLLV